ALVIPRGPVEGSRFLLLRCLGSEKVTARVAPLQCRPTVAGVAADTVLTSPDTRHRAGTLRRRPRPAHAPPPPRAPFSPRRPHRRPPASHGPPHVRLRRLPPPWCHLRDGLAGGSHRSPPSGRAAPRAARGPRRGLLAAPRHGRAPVG